MSRSSDELLRERVEQQARRMERAGRERRTLLAQTAALGVLGLLFVLPVVGGAYLGRWLDSHRPGYSIHWTINLILIGVFVGAVNVYLFLRERT